MLRTNLKILDRVTELRGVCAHRVTVESLIREADAIQRAAMASGQLSAANAALISKAKLSGLWVGKTDNTNRNVDLNSLSDEELADIIAHGSDDKRGCGWIVRQGPQATFCDLNFRASTSARRHCRQHRNRIQPPVKLERDVQQYVAVPRIADLAVIETYKLPNCPDCIALLSPLAFLPGTLPQAQCVRYTTPVCVNVKTA